jgi:hypothetical protein
MLAIGPGGHEEVLSFGDEGPYPPGLLARSLNIGTCVREGWGDASGTGPGAAIPLPGK